MGTVSSFALAGEGVKKAWEAIIAQMNADEKSWREGYLAEHLLHEPNAMLEIIETLAGACKVLRTAEGIGDGYRRTLLEIGGHVVRLLVDLHEQETTMYNETGKERQDAYFNSDGLYHQKEEDQGMEYERDEIIRKLAKRLARLRTLFVAQRALMDEVPDDEVRAGLLLGIENEIENQLTLSSEEQDAISLAEIPF